MKYPCNTYHISESLDSAHLKTIFPLDTPWPIGSFGRFCQFKVLTFQRARSNIAAVTGGGARRDATSSREAGSRSRQDLRTDGGIGVGPISEQRISTDGTSHRFVVAHQPVGREHTDDSGHVRRPHRGQEAKQTSSQLASTSDSRHTLSTFILTSVTALE